MTSALDDHPFITREPVNIAQIAKYLSKVIAGIVPCLPKK
jgi:hypothetical protein